MSSAGEAIDVCNRIIERRLTSMARQGDAGLGTAMMIATYFDGLVYNVSFEDIAKLADVGVLWDDLKTNSPIFDFVIQTTSEFVLRMGIGRSAAIAELNQTIAYSLTACRPTGTSASHISTPTYADNVMGSEMWSAVLGRNPWVTVLYLATLGDRVVTYPDTRKRGHAPL